MRTNEETRKIAEHVVKTGDDKVAKRYGIKGPSCLSELSSIDVPRSFPPDGMHLWWENIIPDLVKHWRGKFFSEAAIASIAAANGYEADDESASLEPERPSSTEGTRKDKRAQKEKKRVGNQGYAKGKKAVKKGAAATAATLAKKFVKTDDPYNIAPEQWFKNGKDMTSSAATFPACFGDPIRDFTDHCHHLKAAEWKIFAFILAPIYMKGQLPDEDYDELVNLIDAIHLCCDYEITTAEILAVESRLHRFVEYYERRYYNWRWERLPACLPVIHQVLHVAQGIRWAGPMYVYWQWPMERVCGMIAATAKSRVAANRNMAISMALNERRNHLPYVVSFPAADVGFEDADGNILLHQLFAKRLRSDRMGPTASKKVLQGVFGKPAKSGTLNNWQRRSLKTYLHLSTTSKDDMLNTKASLEHIPKKCIRWASYAPGGDEPFTVISSTMRRSNSTRNSSMVMYNVTMTDGSLRSAFGEVLFFFTVEEDQEEVVEDLLHIRGLAYVQQFTVVAEERLLRRASLGVKVVIEASSIRELIGLIKNDDRMYIVRRHTSLF